MPHVKLSTLARLRGHAQMILDRLQSAGLGSSTATELARALDDFVDGRDLPEFAPVVDPENPQVPIAPRVIGDDAVVEMPGVLRAHLQDTASALELVLMRSNVLYLGEPALSQLRYSLSEEVV